jgi:pSer/pThr/pTyr-binding forkhead associated (FHA) protein
MKIVLSEESSGQQKPERAYERPVIKIGRDPAECQVVFNQTEWPMVSRRHAEIRLKDGRYLLVDTNSSFGTFLDGQRIGEPVELRQGARAQFGAGGPVMLVVRIEHAEQPKPAPVDFADMETRRDMLTEERPAAAAPPPKPTPQPQPPQPQPPQPAPRPAAVAAAPPPPPPPPSAAASQPAFIEIVRSATGQLERIQVTKDVMMLGRDPATDVAIEASAAVVSRRHAEVQRRDGQFVLVDKGSFNGTLLNDQRITTPTPLYDGDRIQLGMGGPILRFVAPSHPAPAGAQHAGQRALAGAGAPAVAPVAPVSGCTRWSSSRVPAPCSRRSLRLAAAAARASRSY